MILDNQFHVAIPPDRLQPLLLDLERIAPCLPGASITEKVDERTFKGTITVRVGPISVSYAGTASLVEGEQESRHMVMRCEGRETRGAGSANATISIDIDGEGEGTTGRIQSDVAITGRVAQFGKGVMVEVGDRILTQFAQCLESKAGEIEGGTAGIGEDGAAAPASPPVAAKPPQVSVLKILLQVLWGRIRFWRRR